MNQQNIFTAIAAVLILQGVAFFIMGSQLAVSSFPDVDATGHQALGLLLEVVAALSIAVGLIAYATRNTAAVVPAFTVGFTVLLLVTLKHLFADNVNVPIPAVMIQLVIVLLCAYLWAGDRRRGIAHTA